MDVEKTIKNLEARHFKVQHFATGAEAVAYVCAATHNTTVGIGGREITGAHRITVAADLADTEWNVDSDFDAVVLPGGMPGTLNLEASPLVQAAVDAAASRGKLLCAICAAPTVLGHKGLLSGKRAVCFPGMEEGLVGAKVVANPVVRDGNIITAAGAGTAIDFGLAIAAYFTSAEAAGKLRVTMQCR